MGPAIQDQMVTLLPRLRRFALSLAHNADKADDLVQATCERALRRAEEWQPGSRLDSWMYRIMQNIWLDWLRQSASRQTISHEDAEQAGLLTDPSAPIEARLDLDSVCKLIEQMPAIQREVMINVCLQGQSYRECAETLVVPVGTVMSRLARARQTLERKLQ